MARAKAMLAGDRTTFPAAKSSIRRRSSPNAVVAAAA
jgi:hypothetical protein